VPGYGAPPYGAPPYPGPPYGTPPYGQPWRTYNYASWGTRVAATLIDSLLQIVPVIALIILGVAMGNAAGGILIVLGYLASFGIYIWNIVFRQGNTGQTVGKQWLSVKLIRESDGPVVGPGMSFVRNLAHILDQLPCYLGYFWPLWDAKRQTFADKVCSTVVIDV
jgi:uncharacterized RDD family membrane protein YckC